MNNKKLKNSLISSLLTFGFAIAFSTSVQVAQASDYEELSYDDLVRQLSGQSVKTQSSQFQTFDDIQIHAGVGISNSVTQTVIKGDRGQKIHSGFQLSLGIDLFSPRWVAQGVVRNLGQAISGTERRSLREYNMRLIHKIRQGNAGLRLGGALGTRSFRVTDGPNDVYIDDTTPTAGVFGGMDAYLSRNASFVFEVAGRTALVTRTVDKNAMDVTLGMEASF